ncbi:MAG: DUF4337 domain-containing protein [Rhodospirillaceae bacterium]
MMKPDEALEHHEHLEHTSGGHGHASSGKMIAVLIAVLAAMLAVVESGGKASQTEQLSKNIDLSDTYAFYQAKKIRSTVLRTSSALVDTVMADTALAPEKAAKVQKTMADWKEYADSLDSDPKSGEGGKELLIKAKHLTEQRDEAANAYHNFEYGAAALQLSIVLASASVITGMPILAFGGIGLGAVGATLGGLGWFKPHLLHELLHGGGGHGGGH